MSGTSGLIDYGASGQFLEETAMSPPAVSIGGRPGAIEAQVRPGGTTGHGCVWERTTMSVQVECPNCGEQLRVEERLLGSQVRCGTCQTVFVATGAAFPEDVPTVGRQRPEADPGKATASLVLGCIGMIGWLLPIIGLPVTITGLVLGIKGLNSRNNGQAVAGVTLSVIGLILSVANAAIGAYMAATGQHPLVR